MYPPPGMVGPRLIAAWALRTQSRDVQVEGLEHVPAHGPVLIVARHYHHLLDGAVLVQHVRRPLHIVVALDWTADARQRRWMERACRWSQWPVILRPATTPSAAAYDASEIARYLRSGLRDAAHLLRDERAIVVFPEGYPAVDPSASAATPRARDADGFLPFAAGYRTIAQMAQRGGSAPVAIVPVGFAYRREGERFDIVARFGAPLGLGDGPEAVERAVRALSAPSIPAGSG